MLDYCYYFNVTSKPTYVPSLALNTKQRTAMTKYSYSGLQVDYVLSRFIYPELNQYVLR
jgi:hypothetical protein